MKNPTDKKKPALGSIFTEQKDGEYEAYKTKADAYRIKKKDEAFTAFIDRLILFKRPSEEEEKELALIIRTHLFSEQTINNLINRRMNSDLDLEHWAYSKKLELLDSVFSTKHIPLYIRSGLKNLNKIRNNVAHTKKTKKEGAISAFLSDMFSKEALLYSDNKDTEKNLELGCYRVVEILEKIKLHFESHKIDWAAPIVEEEHDKSGNEKPETGE